MAIFIDRKQNRVQVSSDALSKPLKRKNGTWEIGRFSDDDLEKHFKRVTRSKEVEALILEALSLCHYELHQEQDSLVDLRPDFLIDLGFEEKTHYSYTPYERLVYYKLRMPSEDEDYLYEIVVSYELAVSDNPHASHQESHDYLFTDVRLKIISIEEINGYKEFRHKHPDILMEDQIPYTADGYVTEIWLNIHTKQQLLELLRKFKGRRQCPALYVSDAKPLGFEILGAKRIPGANILKAVHFAAEKHINQRRKNAEKSPYINHPLGVANVLANEANVDDETLLIAALLHDTIEDTETNPSELEDLFGIEVRQLVEEVTDDKTLDKEERKNLQLTNVSELSINAKQLRIADKICNIRDIMQSPPVDWRKERKAVYLLWTKVFVDLCHGVANKLENIYDETLYKAWDELQLDADILTSGLDYSIEFIEGGSRWFAEFAEAMIQDFGKAVIPFLKTFYEGAHAYFGTDNIIDEMSDAQEIKDEIKEIKRKYLSIFKPTKKRKGESPMLNFFRMSNLEKAISIAVENHACQVDKAGAPYVLHPLRAMFQMDTELEMIVAVLHDVVEDADVTPDDLRMAGFDNEVIEAVDSVTNRDGESYNDFIVRAGSNPIGYKVKMADLHDNLDLARIAEPTPKDYRRLAKYEKAIKTLKAMQITRKESDMDKITSILIDKRENDRGVTRLSSEISDDGNLIINDYFIGPAAQEFYGHDDVDSFVKIKKIHKDSLLLLLLRDRFEKISELREWLDSAGVPYDFEIWP